MKKNIISILILVIGLTQFSFGQKSVLANKEKLADQLFDQTANILPIDQIESLIRQQIEENIIDSEKKYLLDPFNKQIETDTTLSEERKTELKNKYPAFLKKFRQLLNDLSFEGFEMKKWYQQSFTANISKNFTLAELKKLNSYFSTQEGKDYVQKINQISMEGYLNKIPQPQNPKLKEAIENQDILTKKFMNSLLKDVGKDFGIKMDKWSTVFSSEETKQKNDNEIKRLVAEFFELK